ncbi:MAG: DUF4910 domain-containing protein [Lentisphaeria bacterium]|nr:DUF4910 domain-containing protein [Lentisphaeria bacterium]
MSINTLKKNQPFCSGQVMYSLVKKLFPICRSLTGNGVRETLKELQNIVPEMNIYEVATGTNVFDWTIPKEWNIKDAWIKNSNGKKIIDFKKNNLHVMGYSCPIHQKVNLAELLKCVYTLPDQPDFIPYVTSYYTERYGFCMSEKQKQALREDEYEIFIDATLEDGFLTYADIIIPGKIEKEILFSTYVCHPSMANNELSGPAVAIYLAKWLKEKGNNYYTYRFIFVPETIGSITYISKNLQSLQKNVVAGFVLTCCGDEGDYSYLESRYGNTLADKVAKNILQELHPKYITYSFLDRGSDERQYCSPGVDLPVCSIMRTKYGIYPEYHTSGDDLDFISANGLQETYDVYQKIILALENNKKYKIKCFCEPQLGKRGLYPSVSQKNSAQKIRNMMNFIAYCDGNNDLIDISNIITVPIEELIDYVNKLSEVNLLEYVKE